MSSKVSKKDRTKKGHLNKQHGGFGKKSTWNLYFFEMVGGVYFHYYKNNNSKPAHQIVSMDITKVCTSSKGNATTFEVHFKGNGSPWVLDASSEEEMISWMEVIQPESSKPVVETIQRRQKLKKATTPPSLSSTWSPGQFTSNPAQQQQQQQQQHQQQQQYGNHSNYADPRYVHMKNHPGYPPQYQSGNHGNMVDPRLRNSPVPMHQTVNHGNQTNSPNMASRHLSGEYLSQTLPAGRASFPQQPVCSIQEPPEESCPIQPSPMTHSPTAHSQQQPPSPMARSQQQPPSPMARSQQQSPSPMARSQQQPPSPEGINVGLSQPSTLPVPSPRSKKSLSQPPGESVDGSKQNSTTDIRREGSPVPGKINPYEVFRQSSAVGNGMSDQSGYVVMRPDEKVSPSPQVPPESSKQTKEYEDLKRPMCPEDVFRYFDSSQLSQLAKMFRQMSAAQGKEAPITASGHLDQDAIVEALTGISEDLLEESGQTLDNCTPDETSLDEMSRQALVIENEWLSEAKPIGKGAYGEVFHALLRYTPSSHPIEVAIKTAKSSASQVDKDNFLKEIQVMATLLHPNVVKMYGYINESDSSAYRVVLEFLHQGDLRSFLKKQDTQLSEKHLVKFMYDVASGMHYIASKGMVHRDLAARNVLVSNDGVCKVADFGLLRHVSGDQELYQAQSAFRLPARWMAPESLADLNFSLASDVWSFGILIWEMFNPREKYPYPELNNQQVSIKVIQGHTMAIPQEAHQTVRRIMKQCWSLKPEERPSFLLISSLLCKCHLQLV